MGRLESQTCGEYYLKRDCPHNQEGSTKMYKAQEAQNIADVGQIIPRIYAAVENKKDDHQDSIIEMDDKLCDQVISILTDPGSNYGYVSLYLVNKCGLNK